MEKQVQEFSTFDGRMHKLIQLYRRQFQIFVNEMGLSPGQPPVLMTLCHYNGCTQKELCGYITIKPATMTEILKRMEKNGLIIRKADDKDLRSVRVYLGEKGLTFVRETRQVGYRMAKECFRDFTKEEEEQFLSLLDRCNNNMEESLKKSTGGGGKD